MKHRIAGLGSAAPWPLECGRSSRLCRCFSAPPMTFEVGGKQHIAITSGRSASAKAKLINTPELKDQRQATVLYVFGL